MRDVYDITMTYANLRQVFFFWITAYLDYYYLVSKLTKPCEKFISSLNLDVHEHKFLYVNDKYFFVYIVSWTAITLLTTRKFVLKSCLFTSNTCTCSYMHEILGIYVEEKREIKTPRFILNKSLLWEKFSNDSGEFGVFWKSSTKQSLHHQLSIIIPFKLWLMPKQW